MLSKTDSPIGSSSLYTPAATASCNISANPSCNPSTVPVAIADLILSKTLSCVAPALVSFLNKKVGANISVAPIPAPNTSDKIS